MGTTITINDLTIRQLKELGKMAAVNGWSKLTKGKLVPAIKKAMPDPVALQSRVDELLANGKANGKAQPSTKAQKEQQRLEALIDIAKASGKRMKVEDQLKGRRKELNQEVSESKTSHQGAMEREVDYDDADSVCSKLIAVTEAWQGLNDSREHRRLELAPLKEQLSRARTRERKAFEDSAQCKIKF